MSETAAERLRRLGLDLPGLGLAAEVEWNPAARLQLEQQQAEQQYFGKSLALGLTADDARMVLDREIALATEYRLTPDQMWAGAWDQAIRHCMREPYVKFPNRDQYEAAMAADSYIDSMERLINSAAPTQENASAIQAALLTLRGGESEDAPATSA